MLLDSFLGPTKSTGVEKVYNCPNGCGLKLYVNTSKQLYFCVKCGQEKEFIKGKFSGRGTIQSLLKYFKCPEEHIPLPEKKIVEEPFCEIFFRKTLTELFSHSDKLLSPAHLTYLQKRGFNTNSLHCISSSLALEYLKQNYSNADLLKLQFLKETQKTASWLISGKLLIPYFEYGIVTGVRAKSMLENPTVKYLWADKNKAAQRIYNHDLLLSNKIIIWTEGEFKAALCTEKGYPTIATPGVGIGHENLAFNLCRYNTKFVYVCFDTEEVGSKSEAEVNKCYRRAESILSNLDIPHKRVFIPSTGGKVDLDTYILQEGEEALGALFPLLRNNNRLLHRSNL
jgi:hypothetical protein